MYNMEEVAEGARESVAEVILRIRKSTNDIDESYWLKFTNHTDENCKKASRKLNALARIAPHMSMSKRRTLKSHFNYWALIWMCCNWSLNNEIDRLHELSIAYSDKTSDFSELLEKDSSVSIH